MGAVRSERFRMGPVTGFGWLKGHHRAQGTAAFRAPPEPAFVPERQLAKLLELTIVARAIARQRHPVCLNGLWEAHRSTAAWSGRHRSRPTLRGRQERASRSIRVDLSGEDNQQTFSPPVRGDTQSRPMSNPLPAPDSPNGRQCNSIKAGDEEDIRIGRYRLAAKVPDTP